MYTNAEYYDMIMCVGASANNELVAARSLYQERYPGRLVPSYDCFRRLVHRLHSTGSFHRAATHGGRSGHVSTQREEEVLNLVDEDPRRSTRRVAATVGLSQRKVWSVLNGDGQHPYHYRKVQELTARDFDQRVQFCQWYGNQFSERPDFGAHILWSDEATFTRCGVFNQHNEHFWSQTNPHLSRESRFQHRWSLNVWAGMIGQKLVGPIFLPARLNGTNYLEFLKGPLEDRLEDFSLIEYRDTIFQQDGAPAHYSRSVREYLDEHFQVWIGRSGTVAWPPRSPDLTPLDFFLWGYLKGLVYAEDCDSPEEMRERVISACANISPEIIKKATGAVRRRADMCVLREGRHIESYL